MTHITGMAKIDTGLERVTIIASSSAGRTERKQSFAAYISDCIYLPRQLVPTISRHYSHNGISFTCPGMDKDSHNPERT